MLLLGWFITDVYAQTGGGAASGSEGVNPLVSLGPFVLIFILFYFMLIRPQQKKAKERQEMIDELKKGDRIITSGGLLGTVTTLGVKIITIQIAEGVRVKVMRSNIDELKDSDKD